MEVSQRKRRSILFIIDKNIDKIHIEQLFFHYRCYFSCLETVLYIYRKKQPTMVIYNIDLSGTSRLQFFQQLKFFKRDVFLMILSAYCNRETRIKMLKAGVNAFIDSSLDDEEFFLRINNLHPYGIKFQHIESQVKNGIKEHLYSIFSHYYFSFPKEKKITLTSVAKELALSNRSLQRKLKKETGLSFTEHHCNYRLERGKQLLQQNYFPSEIANILCFSSPSHFACCFRKKYCVTPSDYLTNLA